MIKNATEDHEYSYMRLALAEAEKAKERDEVPVGAIIVHSHTGEILSRASNRSIEQHDPTAHAEVMAIRDACAKLGVQRIPDYDLYVTLEPCAMCAGAISFARLNKVVFGAYDVKGGAVFHGPEFFEQPTCHHHPEIHGGILEEECGALLRNFFALKRKMKKQAQQKNQQDAEDALHNS